jgi:hypothetical protein
MQNKDIFFEDNKNSEGTDDLGLSQLVEGMISIHCGGQVNEWKMEKRNEETLEKIKKREVQFERDDDFARNDIDLESPKFSPQNRLKFIQKRDMS